MSDKSKISEAREEVRRLEERLAEAKPGPGRRNLERKLAEARAKLKKAEEAKAGKEAESKKGKGLSAAAKEFVPREAQERKEEAEEEAEVAWVVPGGPGQAERVYVKHSPQKVYKEHWGPLLAGAAGLTEKERYDLQGTLLYWLSGQPGGLGAKTLALERGQEREQARGELAGMLPAACAAYEGIMWPAGLARKAVAAVCV